MPTFPLIHRVVFRELAVVFLLCTATLLTLLLVGRMLQLRQLFLSQQLGLVDIGLLIVYMSPLFLIMALPISVMLSVFLTFLRMNADRESLALKAGGVGLTKLLPPTLAFCLLDTGFNYFISMEGVALGMESFRETVLDIARTKTRLVLQPGVFNTDFPGLMVYAREVDKKKGTLTDVLMKDETRVMDTSIITAPSGEIDADPARGQIVFTLRDGTMYRGIRQETNLLGFSAYTVRLDVNRIVRGLDMDERKPKEMFWSELAAMSADRDLADERGEAYLHKVRTELHKRLTLPPACFILGLFAMAAAAASHGLPRHWGLLLAMSFFLTYYTLYSVGLGLGETGAVDPAVALWTPNILFLAAGLAGFRLASREKRITFVKRRIKRIGSSGRRLEESEVLRP